MDLIIDFGNTLTKIAIFKGNTEVFLLAVPNIEQEELKQILNRFPVKRSIISSVRNHPSWISHFLEKHSLHTELDENTHLPLQIGYSTPETLGKDRLAAAVAGHMLYPDNDVLVIMAGTCLTYDFVNKQGVYSGGAISPGMKMRFRALHEFTDKLPLCKTKDNIPLTGTTTHESIQSGVVNGMLAEINGIIDQYRKIYNNLTVVLSGGDLNYFDKKLKNNIFAVPNIVLRGLKNILDSHAIEQRQP
ncbi:MAG: type III pantothenate kinase [Bacteroidetes bacterium]|nr:type III pantothenate kinase [Bacteroidota bacterium]